MSFSVKFLCASFQLQDIVQNGLEGNEYVTLLSWILNTYPGTELMGSPEVNVDVSTLPPLLSEDTMQKLQDEYLQVITSFWYKNSLIRPKNDQSNTKLKITI